MSELFHLATWNVNSIKVRAPQVLSWLAEKQPDFLCLQELKLAEDQFPAPAFSELTYQTTVHGQKTWNGVAFASRHPASEITRGLPEMPDDPQARFLSGHIHGVRMIGVYVPNGESLVSEKFVYKMGWLEALALHLETRHRPDEMLAVFGDFNIAPGELDVHDPQIFAGQVLYSDQEHAALKRLMDWGLVDLFRHFHPEEKLFSWWDYRQAAFRRNLGARIDLILVTRPLAERAVSCEIDPTPRKLEKPSDHAPVVASFRLDPAVP